MCSPSVVPLVVNTCMRACTVYRMDSLGGVRRIHECLCLYVRTALVPLIQCFGIDSLGDAPIVRRHDARVLRCACCECTGMDSLGGVRSVHECLCLYVCTVLVQCFGMDSLGDALVVRRPACLGSHAVLVRVQCMT